MMQIPNEGSDLTELGKLAPELASICVSIASDIALVVDADGIIRKVACRNGHTNLEADAWIGQAWAETVTADTRSKVERLLQEAGASGLSRHREVNYRSPGGVDIPVNYAAIRLGDSRTILVAGRDLSSVSSIQQKFVERQQELERDYWQRRNQESHYRLLFQVATDSVMVVDAQSFQIIEANLASAGLFDVSLDNLVGQDVADGIMQLYRPAVHELLITARASGQPAEIRVPLARKIGYIALSATPFRSADGMQLLLRARAANTASSAAEPNRHLVEFVERTPDAVVICNTGGRVIMSNPAFVKLCAAGGDIEVNAQSVAQLLGCPAPAIDNVIAQVHQHGMAAAELVIQRGSRSMVFTLTGALLDDTDQETIGFSIRARDEPVITDPLHGAPITEWLSGIGAQLGERSLPGLLGEANALLRSFFIDIALQRTAGDVTKASELLGVSEHEINEYRAVAPCKDIGAADPASGGALSGD